MEEETPNKGHSENYFGDYRDFWWNQDFLEITAKRLGLNNSRNMLDVGCGQGHWTKTLCPFLAPQAKITAVDNDLKWTNNKKQLSDYFSRRSNPFQLKNANAENLPFKDETFDFVTCQTLLIHLKNPKKALAEMKRVLQPGGLILCVEPNNIVQSLSQSSQSAQQSLEETLDHVKYRLIIEKGKEKMGQGNNSLGGLLPGMFAEEKLKNIEVRLSDKAIAMYPPYDKEEQMATVKQWMQGSSWTSKTQKDIDFFSAAGEEYLAFYLEYQEKYARRGEHILGSLQREQYHAGGGSLMYLVSGKK